MKKFHLFLFVCFLDVFLVSVCSLHFWVWFVSVCHTTYICRKCILDKQGNIFSYACQTIFILWSNYFHMLVKIFSLLLANKQIREIGFVWTKNRVYLFKKKESIPRCLTYFFIFLGKSSKICILFITELRSFKKVSR